MKTRIFDHLPDGSPITAYRLDGSEGAYVELLDYGATILNVYIPDRNGRLRDVTLGYDRILDYRDSDKYFGVTVGRHANRIGKGQFTLNERTYFLDINNGPNHLHGGFNGYHTRFFQVTEAEHALIFSLHSPDGDQGYPGNFKFSVTFRFTEENALHIRYEGISDQDTVVNLTNHSYFDLSAGEDPQGQILWLDADCFTENDPDALPTGRLLPVTGTPFDFTTPKPIRQDLLADDEQLRRCGGYDHNYAINHSNEAFAWLYSEKTGILMTAKTDMPGVQVYTANNVSGAIGKDGRVYQPYDALCLETQYFPNAMAIDTFEKPILKAGTAYIHETIYHFTHKSNQEELV